MLGIPQGSDQTDSLSGGWEYTLYPQDTLPQGKKGGHLLGNPGGWPF